MKKANKPLTLCPKQHISKEKNPNYIQKHKIKNKIKSIKLNEQQIKNYTLNISKQKPVVVKECHTWDLIVGETQ